jgi:hypothetical protein
MEVTPGRGHFLEGRNGARFSGHLYGLARGREEYRVGMDTAEYEEYLAVAYGYPLSSNHLDVTSSGWFDIYALPSCGSTAITFARKPGVPAGIGIGSISLEWGNNARIESIKPLPLDDAATATVVIAPIRADRDASALVSIEDTDGNVTRYRYTRFAEQLDVTVKGHHYETISNLDAIPGVRYTWPVVLTNPLDRAIEVADIKLQRGDQEFSITSIGPRRPPFDLAAGDSITVTIEARPAGNNRRFIDTLSIVCGCQTTKMPLAITTSDPEIMVDDLDFGTFVGLGANSSETMWIRNMGTGTLLFTEGPGGDLISWLHREHFIVAPVDLQRLRTARLGSGDSLALPVRFHGVTEGVFADTARFYSNDGERKGYAIWRADVRRVSGVDDTDADDAGVTIRPNPVTGAATITFLMEHPGDATLSITDAAGREVLSRDLGDLPAGEQRIEWNASSVASGVYLYTLRCGERVVSGTVVVVR